MSVGALFGHPSTPPPKLVAKGSSCASAAEPVGHAHSQTAKKIVRRSGLSRGGGVRFRLPLLDGTVDLDVDDITDPANDRLAPNSQFDEGSSGGCNLLVLLEVGREPDHTLLPELPGEGVSRTSAETSGVTHLDRL